MTRKHANRIINVAFSVPFAFARKDTTAAAPPITATLTPGTGTRTKRYTPMAASATVRNTPDRRCVQTSSSLCRSARISRHYRCPHLGSRHGGWRHHSIEASRRPVEGAHQPEAPTANRLLKSRSPSSRSLKLSGGGQATHRLRAHSVSGVRGTLYARWKAIYEKSPACVSVSSTGAEHSASSLAT
jgi:hypothetical protein